jgi:DNA-binding NtrC family response regulator
MALILVVDDEKSIVDSIRMILEYEKHAVVSAESGAKGLQALASNAVDAILLDIKMPDMDGIDALKEIKKRTPDVPVIMISGHGTFETAVEATRLGAFDYLPKPLDRDKLIISVRNALNQRKLEHEISTVRSATRSKERILGQSGKIKAILDAVARVAATEARVLITGESGTGKELVAKAIHRASKRAAMPFIEVNCAAIPHDLIESELFGHERGSFTGATNQRSGKFEQADNGTLFLDEIGDMSVSAQAKVLRALEEGTFERVGGNKLISVNVRVLAATNKNLQEEIARGNFRQDLFHRLNVIPLVLPPLRERREDIAILALAFIEDTCAQNGFALKKISRNALTALTGMEWNGNVRELRNAVERLVIMSSGSTIENVDVLGSASQGGGSIDDLIATSKNFQEFKDRSEAAYIRYQLDLHDWNVSKTAEALEMERSHLYTKLKKYGLERTS